MMCCLQVCELNAYTWDEVLDCGCDEAAKRVDREEFASS